MGRWHEINLSGDVSDGLGHEGDISAESFVVCWDQISSATYTCVFDAKLAG